MKEKGKEKSSTLSGYREGEEILIDDDEEQGEEVEEEEEEEEEDDSVYGERLVGKRPRNTKASVGFKLRGGGKTVGKKPRSSVHDIEEEERLSRVIRNRAMFNTIADGKRYVDDYCQRNITFGKVVDFEFFKKCGLNLKEMFGRLGWDQFVTIEQPQYTSFVKLFYTNLTSDGNQLNSLVRGTRISLRANDVSSLYHIPRGSIVVKDSTSWIENDECDKETLLQELYGSNYQPGLVLSRTQLTIISRIIHHIICQSILPKTGARDHVSYLECFLIWCILHGKKVDLPTLIMNQMLVCRDRRGGTLPYGMALTTVFRHYDLLRLADDDDRREVGRFDRYDESTIKAMGFVITPEGIGNKSGDDDARKRKRNDNMVGASSSQPKEKSLQDLRTTVEMLSTSVKELQELQASAELIATSTNDLPHLITTVGTLASSVTALRESMTRDCEDMDCKLSDMGRDIDMMKLKGDALYELGERKMAWLVRCIEGIQDDLDALMRKSKMK